MTPNRINLTGSIRPIAVFQFLEAVFRRTPRFASRDSPKRPLVEPTLAAKAC